MHYIQVSESLVPDMALDTVLENAPKLQNLSATSWPQSLCTQQDTDDENHGHAANIREPRNGMHLLNVKCRSAKDGRCTLLKVCMFKSMYRQAYLVFLF